MNIQKLDRLLTTRWFGIPFLICITWLIFQATFTLGEYPMLWIQAGVDALSEWILKLMEAGSLRDLLVNGILAGVGGVMVFLPNILILFFLISFMEEIGYMDRASVVMDELMHKIGLHGNSFIPLLVGFGCNVPAIMATKTIENRRDRILTMLVIPFMSCSARLPVYLLMVSAFFTKNQGLIVFSVYAIGVGVAALTAWVFKRTIFKQSSDHTPKEPQAFRAPRFGKILSHTWEQADEYLKKMGTVILGASILIWALGYYPRHAESAALPLAASVQAEPTQAHPNASLMQLENSYIGKIGKSIAPVLDPIGLDWKMGVSLVSGLTAKEIVVSTMSILYHGDAEDPQGVSGLSENIRKEGMQSLNAFIFILFILLYFPCVATLIAISKQAGKKWAVFSAVYTTGLAWVLCYIVYQIGSLL